MAEGPVRAWGVGRCGSHLHGTGWTRLLGHRVERPPGYCLRALTTRAAQPRGALMLRREAHLRAGVKLACEASTSTGRCERWMNPSSLDRMPTLLCSVGGPERSCTLSRFPCWDGAGMRPHNRRSGRLWWSSASTSRCKSTTSALFNAQVRGARLIGVEPLAHSRAGKALGF